MTADEGIGAQGGWFGIGPQSLQELDHADALLIAEEGSVTRLLEGLTGGSVEVCVLRQGPDTPLADEEWLAAPLGENIQSRQVCLRSEGMPMVVARTIWSAGDGKVHAALTGLGTSPLADLLFAEGRQAETSLREMALLPAGHPLGCLAGSVDPGTHAPFLARRNRYWVEDVPIGVTEVFLPSLRELMAQRTA